MLWCPLYGKKSHSDRDQKTEKTGNYGGCSDDSAQEPAALESMSFLIVITSSKAEVLPQPAQLSNVMPALKALVSLLA